MKRVPLLEAFLFTAAAGLLLLSPAQGAVGGKGSESVKTAGDAPASDKPASDKPAYRDWLVVPVFYATNRSFVGENGNIQYSEEPNNATLFGVKNIAAPVPIHSTIDKATKERMCWQPFRAKVIQTDDPEKAVPTDFDRTKCGVPDRTLSREEIVPAFNTYMKDSGSHEVLLYAHGCCANFDKSMQRAATIAANMQIPVLLYDWASPKGFKKYLENETRAEQTMDDFCRFIAKVEKLTEPGNISLIGHSMGVRFIDEAMVRRSGQMGERTTPRLKELIMCNGDSDAKSFANHAKEFASNAEKSRIYFNRTDDVLDASAMAHGGFPRLGAPGDLVSEMAKTDRMELVDITDNESKHEVPFWIVANLHRYNNLGPVKEFQLKQIAPDHVRVVRTQASKQQATPTLMGCRCE
jgi:esterase/lipase superfamily enzyme